MMTVGSNHSDGISGATSRKYSGSVGKMGTIIPRGPQPAGEIIRIQFGYSNGYTSIRTRFNGHEPPWTYNAQEKEQ
jgi:hypothetical protein